MHVPARTPQTEPQTEPVVPIKKKKKPKKVVKHEEPNTSKLGLDKGPAPAEVGGHDGQVSPGNNGARTWNDDHHESEHHSTSNYQSNYGTDEDEFRNVWGRDEESR